MYQYEAREKREKVIWAQAEDIKNWATEEIRARNEMIYYLHFSPQVQSLTEQFINKFLEDKNR